MTVETEMKEPQFEYKEVEITPASSYSIPPKESSTLSSPMISSFFSRQLSRFSKTPQKVDESYRIFQQRFRENLGPQWAHTTHQPQINESIKELTDLDKHFEKLYAMVNMQVKAMQKVDAIESEAALWYKTEGCLEGNRQIREHMIALSHEYEHVGGGRKFVIQRYEAYARFLDTFRKRAIGDAIATMKAQDQNRVVLDAFGSKLGLLEEKKLKTYARNSHYAGGSIEKDLILTRQKFKVAKENYQASSTCLIDKVGLLELKKKVDFSSNLAAIRKAHEEFYRMIEQKVILEDAEDVTVQMEGLEV